MEWPQDNGDLIAGVDEVGRGPLAGPVVAAAVILEPAAPRIVGLRDSKRLSPTAREQLDKRIREVAHSWSIGVASVEEIDQLNILQATLLAMTRAAEALNTQPVRLLVDGTHCPQTTMPATAVVGGDDRMASIAAASIIAKVYRDTLMVDHARRWPGYGFDSHKGYGTRQHMAALDSLGVCAAHRRSFAPVRKRLERERRRTARAAS